MKTILSVALVCLMLNTHAQSLWTSGRPDGHAPITVMGDHTHSKGEWMIAYRFMHMKMEGLMSGKDKLSESETSAYMMSPEEMHMHMHMLGLMYAVSDHITLMAMSSYIQKHMHMSIHTMMGGHNHFETESAGIGDLRLSALWKLWDDKGQRLQGSLGVAVPLGSIDQQDVTPISDPDKTQLPYGMQMGSGTWDLIPGLTYMGQVERFSWGGQTSAILRLSENARGYTLGNSLNVLSWFAYRISPWVSASMKIKGSSTGSISGKDDTYENPMMSPLLDPSNYGGNIIIGGLGMNIYLPKGIMKNTRMGLEVENPVYQNLNGTGMPMKSTMTLGLQYSW